MDCPEYGIFQVFQTTPEEVERIAIYFSKGTAIPVPAESYMSYSIVMNIFS
jgi:hypothetical protein